jgi:hypothetical protein
MADANPTAAATSGRLPTASHPLLSGRHAVRDIRVTGERHGDGEPAVGAGVGADVAAVRAGHRLHDRQAEADPGRPVADPLVGEAVEGLVQFLAESLLLSVLGGAGGAVLGIAVTSGYASTRGWSTVVPAWATAGGLGATLIIGALAGMYPAVRASRLAPTEALAAT